MRHPPIVSQFSIIVQQTVTDASGTTTYTYDNAGNLITSATPEGTLHYVYNSLNQHTETYTTAVGGTAVLTDITYGYDTLGRLTSMSVNALNGSELSTPLVTQYYYDGAGNLAYQLQVNNGISQEYTYTLQNQIATITDKTGSTQTAAFAYTYDADGNETQEVETMGTAAQPPTETINYTYNADNMLYSETGVATNVGSSFSSLQNWSTYYGYDADGNRIETDGGDFLNPHPAQNAEPDEEQANFWTYNANNELTKYIQYNPDQDNPSNTTTKYTYDANGNEVEADSTTEHQQQEDGDGNDSFQFYTYDVRGEMVKYVDGNGTTTTYTYDDNGNRVKEVTPVSGHNITTTYLIDSNNPTGEAQPIEEHNNGAAVPSTTYFVGPMGTQGQTSGTTVIYMLRDNRGYARIFTNVSGTVTQYDQYDAYGNQTTSNNIPTTHYFPDGTLDPASGLTFHFGGRQSSSVNGDFIERDAQQYGENQSPISLNMYIYADADPINVIDPSGHDGYADTLEATEVSEELETEFDEGLGNAEAKAVEQVGASNLLPTYLGTLGLNLPYIIGIGGAAYFMWTHGAKQRMIRAGTECPKCGCPNNNDATAGQQSTDIFCLPIRTVCNAEYLE